MQLTEEQKRMSAVIDQLERLDARARKLRRKNNIGDVNEEIWAAGSYLRVYTDGYGGADLIEFDDGILYGRANAVVVHQKYFENELDAWRAGEGLYNGETEWASFDTIYERKRNHHANS